MASLRTTSLSEVRSVRYLPKLREQVAQWRDVQAQMQEGRRLAHAFYRVTAFSPEGEGDHAPLP